MNGDALIAALRLVHDFNKNIKVVLVTSHEQNKLVNKNDFDEILDRKMIKDGILKNIFNNISND